ncbi:YihY/virulence factor BrkB family protein [Desulfurivibrio sp. C05AmB]|uniref:YihY/virulence factor BrkB family protein n=1 Tax=Desulfurivibrio sp. C05AmB TaxID=3374371 RepID=UPI00376EA7DE
MKFSESPLAWLRRQHERLQTWIWQNSVAADPLWQRWLRDFLRVLLIFGREFDRDRIPLRASALTFTIILSLVPTLALGTAVLKGLGAGDQMRHAAHRFVDQMESPTILWRDSSEIPRPSVAQDSPPPVTKPLEIPDNGEGISAPATSEPDQEPPAPPAEEAPRLEQTSAMHLRQAIDQIFDYVDRTDFTTLGAFGVVGLVMAVVFVLGSIERSMNAIWHTAGSRPMGRRVMDYLSMMILLPLAINLTLATEATLQSEALQERLQIFLPVGGIEQFFISLMPLLLLTLTFTVLYRFLPNTRVKITPALIGGLFGALAWLIIQSIYLKLQIGVARYNAIYGSFATLPLFLIWLQLCWIIFLSGAEMAFAVQARRSYRLDDTDISPVNKLTLAFAILSVIHRDFKARQVCDPTRLAMKLRQPELVINQVAAILAGVGLIRWVSEDDKGSGYLLGTDLEKVPPTEVLDLIMGTDIPPIRGAALVKEAMAAASQALSNQSLEQI